jgi:hypothetical protein
MIDVLTLVAGVDQTPHIRNTSNDKQRNMITITKRLDDDQINEVY